MVRSVRGSWERWEGRDERTADPREGGRMGGIWGLPPKCGRRGHACPGG